MHDEHMFGMNPLWSRKLHVWGEAGVIAESKHSKMGDKGTTMMFVGYADCKVTVSKYECHWDISHNQC